MNELKIFDNNEFGQIRVTDINGKPYFVANDIAKSLGYSSPKDAITRHCKGALKHRHLTKGGNQEIKIIPEGDVYRLIIKSKLPKAQEFESWVMDDVLPQIRHTGGYIPVEETDDDSLIMAKALKIAETTIQKKDAIIASQNKRIEKLEETEKDWKLLMDCSNTFSINDVGHCINVGEYALFAILRDLKVLFRNVDGDTIPYENKTNKGKFITVPAIAPDGHTHLQTRVLPNGISYITKKLRKNGYLEVA